MFGHEPDNDDRADWAQNAADTFARETYGGRTFSAMVTEQPDVGDDAYTVIQDLMSDLLHLARRHGWKADDLINRARGNFDDEVQEEKDAAHATECPAHDGGACKCGGDVDWEAPTAEEAA